MKSLYWQATHPAYNLLKGLYLCKCGEGFAFKKDLNKHILDQHDEDTAYELMSANDYDHYFPMKLPDNTTEDVAV